MNKSATYSFLKEEFDSLHSQQSIVNSFHRLQDYRLSTMDCL